MPGKLFPLGGPVPERDVVDREDFIVSLQTRLVEGQSIMLAGPRRIGKTSLANEILRRAKKEGFYTSYAFVEPMFQAYLLREFFDPGY